MTEISLQLSGISRQFRRRPVFAGISASVAGGQSLAVTGPNGSGKSTLMKIIAGLLSPSAGTVELTVGSAPIRAEERFAHLGFVSPYLQLYDEFSAWENLACIGSIRGIRRGGADPAELLRMVNLADRRNDPVRTFSSGMKQRLKYAAALLHGPRLLLLDEPTANLDDEGAAMVRSILDRQLVGGGIAIIATNDSAEASLCGSTLDIRDYQGRRAG